MNKVWLVVVPLVALGAVSACHEQKQSDVPSTTSTTITMDPSTPQSSTTPSPMTTPQPTVPPPQADSTDTNRPNFHGDTATSQVQGYGTMDGKDMTTQPPIADDSNARVDTTDSDRALLAHVRKSIMDTQGLSFMAKNVTLQAERGRVTLRGEVKSEAEHVKVLDAASKIAGASNIDDKLTIKR